MSVSGGLLELRTIISLVFGFLIFWHAERPAEGAVGTRSADEDTVLVGILHSQTGAMSFSETPLVDAVRLAIDEINDGGGVLGKRIEAVVLDGESDDQVFANRAAELIRVHHVKAIFGCWTSSSRQAVRTVVEREDALLYYPVQYEGEEPSKNIFYLGAAPNQQLIPAVQWAVAKFRRGDQPLRVYLVGSDYSFPREAHRLIRGMLDPSVAAVVGEDLVPLTATRFEDIASKVASLKPDVVFNTLNGRSNFGFFADLVRAGIGAADVPVLSFSIGEPEIRRAGTEGTEGHYAAWNYLAAVQTPAAERFQERWRRHQIEKRQGAVDVPTSDPIEASYLSVHLWAEAVRRAGGFEVAGVRESSKGIILDAPEGVVRLDPQNQHLWKPIRIGRVGLHGDLLPIMESGYPVAPEPRPAISPELLRVSPWLPPKPRSIAEAKRLLAADAPPSRIVALRFIADSGAVDPGIVADVAPLLNDPYWSVRADAASTMLGLGGAAHVELARLLAEGSGDDRLLILSLTGQESLRRTTNDPSPVIFAVESLLRDPDPLVTFAAMRLLNAATPSVRVSNVDVWPHLKNADVQHRAEAVRLLKLVDRPMLDDLDELMAAVRVDRGPLARPVVREAVGTLAWFVDRWSNAPGPHQVQRLRSAGDLLATLLPQDETMLRTRARIDAMVPVELLHKRLWLAATASWQSAVVALILAFVVLWPLFLMTLYVVHPLGIVRLDAGLAVWQAGLAQLNDWLTTPIRLLISLVNPQWLKHTDRVLDAWVSRHAGAARASYTGKRLRDDDGKEQILEHYFPLPLVVDGKLIREPNSSAFAPLAEATPFRLFIKGDGGSGKTTLAVQIGLWAIDGELWHGRAAIPLLLQRRTAGEKQITTTAELDDAISSTLRETAGLEELPSHDFVNALLRRKRILLIVDDVVKMMPDGGNLLTGRDVHANAVVVTSRAMVAFAARRHNEVRTERLQDSEILREFLQQCVAERAEALADVQLRETLIAEESDRLRQMNTAMPALFVRLYADMLVDTSRRGRLPPTDLVGIAGIVERYVVSVIESSMLDDVRNEDAIRGIHLLAWACVGEHFRAEVIHRPAAVAALKECGGEATLDTLLQKIRLIERAGERHDLVMFSLDPLSEYLAAVAVYRAEIPAEDLDELQRRLAERALSTSGERTPEPFLVALAELLREPKLSNPKLATIRQLLQAASRPRAKTRRRKLPIGILHSLQGTMSISEYSLVRAARLAVEEVNQAQLIPDHEIVAEVCDGESNNEVFATRARQLIVDREVVSVFGCWTSASRRRVLPTIEEYRNLLWYPVQYEGYEKSPFVIYTGAAPNQQIIPAVRWFGRTHNNALRVMMIGTNYLFPRRANQIAQKLIEQEKLGEVLEEPIYLEFSDMDLRDIAQRIRRLKPNLVFNTINGETNTAFFRQLADAGVDARESPVLSVSIAEEEITRIGPKLVEGHFAAWNYFQSLDTPENRKFRETVTGRFGSGCVTSDPIAMAYTQVHLFALACRKAVEAGRPLTPEVIAESARGLEFDAPCGRVRIDEENQHLWKSFMLGRADEDGQFEIVDRSKEWLRPDPFPFEELSPLTTDVTVA